MTTIPDQYVGGNRVSRVRLGSEGGKACLARERGSQRRKRHATEGRPYKTRRQGQDGQKRKYKKHRGTGKYGERYRTYLQPEALHKSQSARRRGSGESDERGGNDCADKPRRGTEIQAVRHRKSLGLGNETESYQVAAASRLFGRAGRSGQAEQRATSDESAQRAVEATSGEKEISVAARLCLGRPWTPHRGALDWSLSGPVDAVGDRPLHGIRHWHRFGMALVPLGWPLLASSCPANVAASGKSRNRRGRSRKETYLPFRSSRNPHSAGCGVLRCRWLLASTSQSWRENNKVSCDTSARSMPRRQRVNADILRVSPYC